NRNYFRIRAGNGLMYYTAKGLELLGMTMIGIGFILKFPSLMDTKLLLGGLICFASGWVIEKYILD
ncbi:MAG: hypothetical protein ABGX14_03505, partial [bacterium]